MTTKHERMHRLISGLLELGFTYDEANSLRRIEMTLSRWSEHECNGNIRRDGDDGDGAPRWYYETATGEYKRGWIIPDRERGALKRLARIVADCNARLTAEGKTANALVEAYHQGDPRGVSLYLVRRADIPEGRSISEFYTRGIAVAA